MIKIIPGTNLTTGQWVRVANPDDLLTVTITKNDSFIFTEVTSPNATPCLYLAGILSASSTSVVYPLNVH